LLTKTEIAATTLGPSRIARDTLVTTSLGVVGRSANLLIPFLVGGILGATGETDSLFIALGILVLFAGVFTWAIEAVMVPYVVKLRLAEPNRLPTFIGGVMLLMGAGMLTIELVLLAVAKPLLLTLTGLSVERVHTVCLLLVELSPALVLMMLSSVLSGVLNAYRIFWAPAISTTVSVLTVISTLLLGFECFGVHAVALGYVGGELGRLLLLWIVLRRNDVGPFPFTLAERRLLREFINLSSFMIVGMAVAGLPPLINRVIASHWAPGSVSVVEYAEKLFYVPQGLLNSGFLTVLLSYWSHGFETQGERQFRSAVYTTVLLLGAGILLASLLVYRFRYSLVALILGWGKISKASLMEVAALYGVYLLGLVPNAVGLVLVRAHLVLKNTRVLFETAVVGVAVLLLFNAWLAPRFGLRGIALAVVASQTAYCIYLFERLRSSSGSSGPLRPMAMLGRD